MTTSASMPPTGTGSAPAPVIPEGDGGAATGRAATGQLLLVLGVGLTLLASLAVREILPEQFIWDSLHLEAAMERGAAATDAESFQDVAAAYEMFGLDRAPSLAALLGMVLYAFAIVVAVGWERAARITLIDLMIVLAFFVPALAYLAQYTKETATVVLTLVVLFAPTGAAAAARARDAAWTEQETAGTGRGTMIFGEAVIVIACILYGALLRPYWLLIAAFYVAARILLPRTRNPLLLLGAVAIAYAVLQPMFWAIFGSGLQGQREWSNAERAGTGIEVNTLIQSIAPEANGVMGVLAALAMVGLMIVPIQLLLSGSAYHLAAGVAIAAVWVLVLLRVFSGELRRQPGTASTVPQAEGGVRPGAAEGRHLVAVRAAAVLLSMLVVQALFEPDYGSVLKHLTPLLPLVLTLHLHGRRS